jgi:hypothetical protein
MQSVFYIGNALLHQWKNGILRRNTTSAHYFPFRAQTSLIAALQTPPMKYFTVTKTGQSLRLSGIMEYTMIMRNLRQALKAV